MELILKNHIEECCSIESGRIVFHLLNDILLNEKCIVSFRGFDFCTNTFVVLAFINLLKKYSFQYIKEHLHFINTNKQINYLIKHRFENEKKRRN